MYLLLYLLALCSTVSSTIVLSLPEFVAVNEAFTVSWTRDNGDPVRFSIRPVGPGQNADPTLDGLIGISTTSNTLTGNVRVICDTVGFNVIKVFDTQDLSKILATSDPFPVGTRPDGTVSAAVLVTTTGIPGAASTTGIPGAATTTGIPGAATTTGIPGVASTTGIPGAASINTKTGSTQSAGRDLVPSSLTLSTPLTNSSQTISPGPTGVATVGSSSGTSHTSPGSIAGATIGSLVVLAIILFLTRRKYLQARSKRLPSDLESHGSSSTKPSSLSPIQGAVSSARPFEPLRPTTAAITPFLLQTDTAERENTLPSIQTTQPTFNSPTSNSSGSSSSRNGERLEQGVLTQLSPATGTSPTSSAIPSGDLSAAYDIAGQNIWLRSGGRALSTTTSTTYDPPPAYAPPYSARHLVEKR